MMWNTKYGHAGMMGGWRQAPTAEMPVTQDEALSIAQEYLDRYLPGTIAEDSHPFYGYYTIHVSKDGEIYGMLSVHGTDGTALLSRVERYTKSDIQKEVTFFFPNSVR